MKAKNAFFLSIGVVLLVASFVATGVLYFKLKNVTQEKQIFAEREKQVEQPKTDNKIEWFGTNKKLSAEENMTILTAAYPEYTAILEKFDAIKKLCPSDSGTFDGDASENCGFLAYNRPEIQLFLVGETGSSKLPVYYLVEPLVYVDGPSPGYWTFLAIYDKDNNRLIRINVNKDDATIDPNPTYGFTGYPDMTSEEQSQFSFNLFTDTVKVQFPELLPPKEIQLPHDNSGTVLELKGGRYAGSPSWNEIGDLGDFGIMITDLDQTYANKFEEQRVAFIDQNIGNVYFNGECYFILNKAGSIFIYDLKPYFLKSITPKEAEKEFYANAQSLDVSQNNDIKETEHFINGAQTGGCGGTLNDCPGIVADTGSFTDNNLVVVAKTKKGDSIYELKDRLNSLIYWKLYLQSGKTVDGAYSIETPDVKAMSKAGILKSYTDFTNDHPILFWKDFAGNWRKLQKTKYIQAAECGKPVIYLYPEKDTDVKVEVKPNGGFTKTEPMYDNGWFVRATPQSELFNYTDKTSYPYLFWEGKAYNFVTPNYGFVMSKAEVEIKMPKILAKLGLNEKETRDFLEFWQPKLEVKPYVFVTFLPQREFDKLAPLTVNPKPDTIIRVFMDYTPLDAPVKVAPMQIRTPERVGFTVVEWGGRLH